MGLYREFRFFSAALDADAVRLSMTDDRGQEYYAIVEAAVGRRWRERREAALARIEDAIALGYAPGEIRMGEF